MTDVAGYRVLRSAATGSRTRLVVGFAEGRTVVLKVARRGDERAVVELEALDRARGEHVVALEDVDLGDDETVLVLERLGGGTLAELLDRRAGLDAGEAVTVLAPLALTLDRVHRAGVAHRALSVGAVVFRDDGTPVLTGFGAAELFPPEAPEVVLEGIDGVRADREACADLARLVLGRVTGTGASAARRLADRLEGMPPAALAALLFDLAAPAAVRFEDDAADSGITRPVAMADPVAAEEPRTVLPPVLAGLIPEGLRERIEQPLARGRALWAGWSSTRRRLVLGGGAGVLVLVVALVALPGGSDPSRAAPPAASADPTPVATEPDLPEDPVEAAILLLERREACLRDLSLLCLEEVDQPGSAALADDRALVRDLGTGGELPAGTIPDGDPVLVERLGDSALLDLPTGSDPASILLMRTEEGWRIRDLLPAATPPA